MKIAIIGTGISGLGAAYFLGKNHDITIFEKNNYLGGHSRTIDVTIAEKRIPVDTGFIVFNDRNYPNLMALFKELNVPFEKSDMSFGVSIDNGWLEYSSSHMFAQSKNLLRPSFYRMLYNILRFNQNGRRFIENESALTLGQYLQQLKTCNWFERYYLLAMGAAIWSCSVKTISMYPANSFLRFFQNHGLLNIKDRPQWFTVTGGSRNYITRLTNSFKENIKLECGVKKISPLNGKVIVHDEHDNQEEFDHVILACHANEAIGMIDQPTEQEERFLKSFTYQRNSIIVHRDTSFMPKNKKCWASWVYLSEQKKDNNHMVSLSYWMNNLQNLDPAHPIILTLNPSRRPKQELIHDEHSFSHPIFTTQSIEAQKDIKTIQGKRGLWFAGAYQRYGFHEDGLQSAIKVAKQLGGTIPWQ